MGTNFVDLPAGTPLTQLDLKEELPWDNRLVAVPLDELQTWKTHWCGCRRSVAQLRCIKMRTQYLDPELRCFLF